jgi:hypothetical protein
MSSFQLDHKSHNELHKVAQFFHDKDGGGWKEKKNPDLNKLF